MASRKMSFFEFWRSKKEREELLLRANQLRLLPSQLRQLHGDSGVQAALQDSRLASLLPPCGTDVFRRFSAASLKEIQQQPHDVELKEKEPKKKKKKEEAAEKDKPSEDLEAGKPLPFIYGDPPAELLNTPLEELDPFHQSQKTFVVIGRGNIIHRFSAESACSLLSPLNPLRTAAIRVLLHPLFNFFILATILTNCVVMTLSEPEAWSQAVEFMFIGIYTLEVVVKVASRGVCFRRFTFLRDPWNWLDVIVIFMGYLSIFVQLCKLCSAIPRVLKIITVVPGLRATVAALVRLLKKLAGVGVLIVFWLSIFAMIGLQLFMGRLNQKCMMSFYNLTLESKFDFNEYRENMSNWYILPNHYDALLCGNSSDAGICPEGFICLRGGRNPNYGYTNFDNFGWSLLSQFRLLTGDYWENLMQLTLRSAGKFYLTTFLLVFLPGCFCLLGLFVAVVAMASVEPEKLRVAAAKRKEEEFHRILEALKKRERQQQAASEIEDGENKSEEQKLVEEPRSCCPWWSAFADRFLRWSCCGCCPQLQAVAVSPFFDLAIVACLVVNTVLMATVHYPMTYEFAEALMTGEVIFTMIFTAEMVIKLMAVGLRGYFQVGWNVFDCAIVVLSLMELFLMDVSVNLFPFVVLRVVRLARWWWSFQMLLKLMWTSVRAVRNLTLLLLVMVFLFSVVGTQLFGASYTSCSCRITLDCELPRWHMADFYHSFLVIARVLCGEWIEVLWDCMEVSSQAICLIYFTVVVFVMYLLALNLFLTLLLSSFSYECVEAPEPKEKSKDISRLNAAVASIKTWVVGHVCPSQGKKKHETPDDTGRKDYLTLDLTSDQLASEHSTLSGDHGKLTGKHHKTESRRAPIADTEAEFETPEIEDEKEKECDDVQKQVQQDKDDHKGNTPEDCFSNKCRRCCPFQDVDTSRGVGRVWFNLRRTCFTIVRHPAFEVFMIFVIAMSSVALVFEDIHLPNRRLLGELLQKADQVFTFVFLLEMLLKWAGLGLRRYFSDAWCWFDFLVLDVSLLFLAFGGVGAANLSVLRSLRALMPLRAVSRFQGLRVVVHTVARSVPVLVNLLLVFLVVWLIFAVSGVNLLAGKFHYCFNETSEEIFHSSDISNKSDCFLLITENYSEVTWRNTRQHFDNVGEAYLSLLHVTVANDWLDILYSAVDSEMVEAQPTYEAHLSMYLYFICFFVVSSFFTFNLFVRVVVDKMQKDQIRKRIFTTEQQEKYFRALRERLAKEPQKTAPRPQSRCLARLFDLVTRPCFEAVMVAVICLNMLVLMVETIDDSHQKYEIIYFFHFAFILVFLIEVILKITALRKHYFLDALNVVDFVTLILTILGFFISDLLFMYVMSPYVFAALRLGRISRVLHLVPSTKGIRRALLAFVMSLPAIFNIGLLLFLVSVALSVYGMVNFAFVQKAGDIDDMFNFETFASSLICVVSGVFRSGAVTLGTAAPDCDPDLENPGSAVRGDCGSQLPTAIFGVASIVAIFLLTLHLFIAVLLEVFRSEDAGTLSDGDLQVFYDTWRQFDPEASQFIPHSKLSDFCDALQDPLRIPKPNTVRLVHMDLPLLPGDKIHYSDVLLALAAQVSADHLEALRGKMEEKFTAKVSTEPVSSTLRRKQEEVAAAVIQRAFRRRRGGEQPEEGGASA